MTIRVNRFHLVVAFCIIILPYILQDVMINVSKTGNTKSLFETQSMVHRTEYKADSFNLYAIDNYVKRTIRRCIPQIE